MKQPIKIIQEEPALSIYWLLTDFCNYRCNYCPTDLHSGNYAMGKVKGFPTDDAIINFVDRLKNSEITDRHLNVQLGGGEPTLHPLFPFIVNSLRSNKNFLGVTTNGSRGLEWWEKVLPLDNVTLSLQPEFTNIEKINEVSKLILDSGSVLQFNLSCDPKNWSRTQDLYNRLDDNLKQFVIPKVLYNAQNIRENYAYTAEQYAWMNSILGKIPKIEKFKNSIVYFDDGTKDVFTLSRMTLNQWNKFKGWQCSVASQGLMINYNGEVWAGLCQSKKLGTIENFRLGEDIICPFEYCACPLDIRADKYMLQ